MVYLLGVVRGATKKLPYLHKWNCISRFPPRYASTLVTHTVENPASEAKEVSFNLLLPDTAFVSRWVLTEGWAGEIALV